MTSLFEENVGPDRLSDMIATIILPDIRAYTIMIISADGKVSSVDFEDPMEKFWA